MPHPASEFPKLESDLTANADDFSSSTNVDIMARSLLVATENLKEIKEDIETTEALADHVGDQHKFQHTLVHSAVSAFQSLFYSLKYHLYNSGYRDIRYLFESYLLLRGLNIRKDEAEDLWRTYRIQAQSIVGGTKQMVTFPFDHIDELGSIRDSERDKLYEEFDEFRTVFNYISNRAAHPLRHEGSYLEGENNKGEKEQQLVISLSILVAITAEFLETWEGTPIESHISNDIETIMEQALDPLPRKVPVFLDPYLDN